MSTEPNSYSRETYGIARVYLTEGSYTRAQLVEFIKQLDQLNVEAKRTADQMMNSKPPPSIDLSEAALEQACIDLAAWSIRSGKRLTITPTHWIQEQTDMTPTECAAMPNDGPRVTEEQVNTAIVEVQYWVPNGTQLTVCCLKLYNGFTVTGEAACVSPENFRQDIGRDLAYSKALDKVWMLLGFRLADRSAAWRDA